MHSKRFRFVQIEGEVLQVRQVKLCKLGGRDLALIAIKLMQEKGAKEITDVHVEVFVRIVNKYCEVFREEYSAESPCHHKSEQFPSSFNEK